MATTVTFDVSPTAGQALVVDTTITSGTITWDFGDGSPTESTADINHTYATGGTYSVSLTVTDEDGLTFFRIDTDTTATTDIPSFTNANGLRTLNLSTGVVQGNASSLSGLTQLTALYLYLSQITGDSSSLSGLINLENFHAGNSTALNIDIGDFSACSNLHEFQAYYTYGRTTGSISHFVDNYDLSHLNLAAAHLDGGSTLNSFFLTAYDNRASYTGNPIVNVASGIPRPLSGSYEAPPANGVSNANWSWDAGNSQHHPRTGNAAIYALVNDPNAEGFNTWTITYDSNAGYTVVGFEVTPTAGQNIVVDTTIGAGNIEWDFGDGSTLETTADIDHTYATGGTYYVTLIVDDTAGLTHFSIPASTTLSENTAYDFSFINADSLISIDCRDSSVRIELVALSGLTQLSTLVLGGSYSTGQLSDISGVVNITNLQIYGGNVNITGTTSDIAAMNQMYVLHIEGRSGITGSASEWSGWTEIDYISVSSSGITMSASDIAGWTKMRTLLAKNVLSGNLENLPQAGKITGLYLSGSNATGYPTTSSMNVVAGGLVIDAKNANQASSELNSFLLAYYSDRSSFSHVSPSLTIYIDGTSSLSGSYEAPPANGVSNANWSWNSGAMRHDPLTGYAAIYALVNDPNSEGFNTWTITYDAQAAPVVTNPGTQNDTESLQIVSTNPGNNALIYSATGLPTGKTIDAETGLIEGPASVGAFSVEVTVSDGFGMSDIEFFTWNITVAQGFTINNDMPISAAAMTEVQRMFNTGIRSPLSRRLH